VSEDAADTVVDLFAAFADLEDADPALTYTITGNTNAALFASTPIDGVAGELTLDYAADANGAADITVRATDTGGLFVETTFTVTVNPVNDAPTTVGIGNVTVSEDAADTVVDLFAAFADLEDADPALTYTITGNTNAALFNSTTIDGVAGELTLDYATDANGAADITVRATDTGGLFVETTFTVTVNPINDWPTTVGIANVAVAEDAANTIIDLFAAFDDLEDPDPAMTYTVVGNTNPALFSATAVNGAAGTLTLDYAANANGAATITVRATDSGGAFVDTSFNVTVAPLPDSPLSTGDAYTVTVDETLNIAPAGVMANDADPDGDPITAVLVSGPATGRWS
jgi:predicted secreted Zn-dependent protease